MHTTFFYLHVIYRKCLQSNEKEKRMKFVRKTEKKMYINPFLEMCVGKQFRSMLVFYHFIGLFYYRWMNWLKIAHKLAKYKNFVKVLQHSHLKYSNIRNRKAEKNRRNDTKEKKSKFQPDVSVPKNRKEKGWDLY